MQDNQSPELFGQTPWQTVGPFFHYALTWHGGADLTGASDLGARPDLVPAGHHDALLRPRLRAAAQGSPIRLGGRVLDGAGMPVEDAMIETWQAGAEGIFPTGRHGGFPGFGRAATGADGAWHILTVKPAAVSVPDGIQAPHIAIGVLGRGLLKRLVTRAYFEGDAANEADTILSLVPPERRHTLLAREEDGAWRFDIILQGSGETVFFDV